MNIRLLIDSIMQQTTVLIERPLSRILLVALPVTSCGSEPSPHDCELRVELDARAGPGAVDCGHVAVGGDTAAIDACVIGAFASRLPFLAEYDQQGIDTADTVGLAGDRLGTVIFLRWQLALFSSEPKTMTTAETCEGPSVVSTRPGDNTNEPPIACTSTVALGKICG